MRRGLVKGTTGITGTNDSLTLNYQYFGDCDVLMYL